jgi:hypothetical protein
MLKNPSNFVLASLNPSTYSSEYASGIRSLGLLREGACLGTPGVGG